MSRPLESVPTELRDAVITAVSADSVDAMRIAEDLFGIADLLHTDSRMRRALSDPSRSVEDKSSLVQQAFASHVVPETLQVLHAVVGAHWSQPEQLPVAVEEAGVYVLLSAAVHSGELVTVEQELFKVQELLSDNRDLRMALSDMGLNTPHDRAELAQSLLKEHLSVFSMRLVRRAVGRSEHGRLLSKLRGYAEIAAALDNRTLVTVETAVALSEQQQDRLRHLMAKRLGTDVTLAITVDPTVVGGFRLVAENEAVDASVAARLVELRRTLVG